MVLRETSPDGYVYQKESCPTCDEEFENQRKLLKQRQQEVDRQLGQLDEGDDNDNWEQSVEGMHTVQDETDADSAKERHGEAALVAAPAPPKIPQSDTGQRSGTDDIIEHASSVPTPTGTSETTSHRHRHHHHHRRHHRHSEQHKDAKGEEKPMVEANKNAEVDVDIDARGQPDEKVENASSLPTPTGTTEETSHRHRPHHHHHRHSEQHADETSNTDANASNQRGCAIDNTRDETTLQASPSSQSAQSTFPYQVRRGRTDEEVGLALSYHRHRGYSNRLQDQEFR